MSAAYDRFRPAREDRDLCASIGVPAGGVHPYGFAEIGAYNFREELLGGRVKISESKTHLGGGFGAGLRVDVGSRWGLGGELPVRWWHEPQSGGHVNYWYLEPNGFVYIRFGP